MTFYEAHREAGLAALRGGSSPDDARRALEAALAVQPDAEDAPALRSALAGLAQPEDGKASEGPAEGSRGGL